MSGEANRRRLRALLRLADVRRPGDLSGVAAAFVHQSHAKERGGSSNERLEFLGDSVLACITARWLYDRYGDEPEGLLSLRKAAIVNDVVLAQTARHLGFSALLQLGSGMRASGGSENTSMLADAFEAFVGAVYLRYGLEKAQEFVIAHHIERLQHSPEALLDAKTRLQHYAQEHLAATPVYRERARGTPQQPAFSSAVVVNGKVLGKGQGFSKKSAQQAAAQAALEALAATGDGAMPT